MNKQIKEERHKGMKEKIKKQERKAERNKQIIN